MWEFRAAEIYKSWKIVINYRHELFKSQWLDKYYTGLYTHVYIFVLKNRDRQCLLWTYLYIYI